MSDLTQFSVLVGLWVAGLALFTFLFTRLERRMDRLDQRMDQFHTDFQELRRDLAEEFRTQRAQVAARVSAIGWRRA